MAARKDFLSLPAPENYVAGLGRGATGFVTRSDLGPGKDGPSEDQIKDALAKRAAQLGAAAPTAYGVTESKVEEDEEERFGDLDNDVGLFASGMYGPDDEEADRIWADVDAKMAKARSNPKKEAARLKREEEEKKKNPSISDRFADLRRGLGTVTAEEWENLPEAEDMTAKIKRERKDRLNTRRFYSVPDTVISGAKDYSNMNTSIAVNEEEEDDQPKGSRFVDFNAIGAAKSRAFGAVMDNLEESTGTNKHRTAEHLKELADYESNLPTVRNVGDLERARELFESITTTHADSSAGWISWARLEEDNGRAEEGRELIVRGTEHCPRDPAIWREAVRMWKKENLLNAKKLIYDGVKYNPKSYELWMTAVDMEEKIETKKEVIRQALDNMPVSESLWKLAANLEDDASDTRLILSKAVEFLPKSKDLWIALVRMEERIGGIKKAQSALNRARRELPTAHEIWLEAIKLLLRAGDEQTAKDTMPRCIKYLKDKSAMLARSDWIAEAEKAEMEGYPVLAALIINETFGHELSEDDMRLEIWKEDADACVSHDTIKTAKAMYAYMINTFNDMPKAWSLAIEFYRYHGTQEEVLDHLEQATESCPEEDDFWLHRAKELFRAGRLEEAGAVINTALDAKHSEKRFLATMDLEINAGLKQDAAYHFKLARKSMATDRVWMKSVVLERSLGNLDEAQALINEALRLWPYNAKMHMIRGQLFEMKSDLRAAREAYNAGTQVCPQSVPLWILAVRLEARATGLTKARTVMDRARLANSKNEELWLEVVRMERMNNKNERRTQDATTMVNRALMECPRSGRLMTEKILYLEDRAHRKTSALQAMRTLGENDKYIFLTVARIFWSQRAFEKAVVWFEKVIKTDPDFADGWAWYYAFLMKHGTEEKKREVIHRLELEEPRHGEIWPKVVKAPQNLGKGTEELLKLVVAELKDPMWKSGSTN